MLSAAFVVAHDTAAGMPQARASVHRQYAARESAVRKPCLAAFHENLLPAQLRLPVAQPRRADGIRNQHDMLSPLHTP